MINSRLAVISTTGKNASNVALSGFLQFSALSTICMDLIYLFGWFKTSFEDDLRDFKLIRAKEFYKKNQLWIQSWKPDTYGIP